MNLDVTFEQSPLEALLEALEYGSTLRAGSFLALLEGADEEEAEQALQVLESRHVTLDISDLPGQDTAGETAVRLRREAELVRQGSLLTQLDENDPLRLYLEELAAIAVAGDPQVLAMELLDGVLSAAQRLADLQLHRVVELATQLTGRGVLLLDLIQEGSLGLWQGLLNYSGGEIEAHCDWWIRQYMARIILLQARAGGVGQKLRRGLKDYVDVDQRLLAELGRNPTVEEIADAMHISVQDAAVYEDMLRSARSRQQVDAAREPAEPTPEDDQAVEDTAYFQSRQRILEMLSTLTEQESKLLTLRYGLEGGLPLNPQQVGARLGMTAEEVVTVEAAALAKLRSN